MNDQTVGRTLRALRHRRGWRQADLASAARVSRSLVSRLESGSLDSHALGGLRRAFAAVGGSVRLQVTVPGGDLDRLLDADHAVLQSRWLSRLGELGWVAVAEVTFNVYGERGSIDILGWHPATRTLLVGEIKTVIVEAGRVVAGIDRKGRLGRTVARERGWIPASVVPALVVLDGTTARRRLHEHAPLFGGLNLRGKAAVSWLRAPAGPVPTGLLILAKAPRAHRGDRRRAGRQRVRIPSEQSRSKPAPDVFSRPPPRA